MFWRFHEGVFDGRVDEAVEAARALGCETQVVCGAAPNLPELAAEPGSRVCAMTTIQDAKALSGKPGVRLFFDNAGYGVSSWMPLLPKGVEALGKGGVFMPFGMARSIGDGLRSALGGADGGVFIKPNDGMKAFPGVVVPGGVGFEEGLNGVLMRFPSDATLCFLAPAKRVPKEEWRFWIVGGKVVARSPYSWSEDEKQGALSAPAVCEEAAQRLAASGWQAPDGAYVADFCETTDGAALVEINAASTSGVYKADVAAVVTALTAALEHELSDDFCGWNEWAGALSQARARPASMR